MGKLDAIMRKGFRSSKCKTLLKLTVARVKILSNKKELQCKQLRKDIAQLLQNNQEASARLRVEHLFRERNILDAYLLIGGYCEATSERIKFIKMQKTCPDDMRESIASLVFAAPRCADLPELQDVRSLFTAKYGKEFTESAVELRAGCGVNSRMIEKLSTRVPSSEVKLRLLKEIASENGIKWSFEEVDVKKLKSTEVQDGSKQDLETTRTTLKPQDVTHEPVEIPFMASKAPDNVRQLASGTKGKHGTRSSTEQGPEGLPSPGIYNSNSSLDPLNIKMDSVVYPISTIDIDLNISDNDLYDRQGKDSEMDFHKSARNTAAYQNIPISDTNHDFVMFPKLDAGLKHENAKYKDVATAAQAAFESAAYAAVAARAAVELAKIEVLNKMPNESVHDPRETISESEDGLGEATPRKRTDKKIPVSPGGRSGTEGTFSTRNDQAAWAAVELAKIEVLNKMPNESVNDPREMISESEDGLGEATPRKRTDKKIAASPGGRSGTEGTFSTRNDQAFNIISPRKRNGANDVYHSVSGFMETQYSGRDVPDSESGEEASEDQDFWSKNRSHVQKSSQKHLSNYSDGEKELETDSLRKDGNPNNEQVYKGMNEPQFKRSMSSSTSSSSKRSLSPKNSHPMFDDYSDDEDEKNATASYSSQSILTAKNSGTEDTHLGNTKYANTNSHPMFDDYSDDEDEKNATASYNNQSILTAKNSGTEDTHLGNTKYANNQRQLHHYDENDEYEKGNTRKESKNQGFTHETSGPPKLSYGNLLQKENRSLNHSELHSENEMEMLNDDNVKFQGQRKSSTLNLHAPGSYQSAIPVKNRVGAVSADQSTYPGYMGNRKEYQPHHGNKNHHFNKQDSDDEGVYRYKGDGKLSWQPANIEEQHSSVASRKSYNVDTRLSVRTRR